MKVKNCEEALSAHLAMKATFVHQSSCGGTDWKYENHQKQASL